MFGEQSALNDLPNPFTVVATTKMEYYKIHRSNFTSYFGGASGEPVNAMRAEMILKANWMHSKIQAIECMDVAARMRLEYCSEQDLTSLKPKLS